MGDDKKYTVVCSTAELLFYIYFGIMLFAKGIGLYEGMAAYNICLALSTGILALKLAMDKYSLKELAVMGALVLTGLLIWKNAGEKGPLLYLLLIIGMKGIPVKRVFKVGLLVWGSAFVIQILLTLSGLKSDIFMAHDKLGLGHIIRWSLGYPHPNVLHISYVILIALLLYVLDLKGTKLLKAAALCFAGNLYIFMYSVSYTGFLLTTVYLIGSLYLNLRTERTKFEHVLVEAVFPFCVIFSVAGPLVIKGRLFDMIDKVLNTRFFMSNQYLTAGKWTLFGSRQPEMKEISTNFTLDCSYTYLLMYCGVVIFILMCAGYLLLIHRYEKENKNRELAIIIGLLTAGISEPFLFNTAYKNLGLIFMGSYMFDALNKRESSVWIRLLPFGERTITVSCRPVFETAAGIRNAFFRKKRYILTAGAAAGLLACLLNAAFVKLPDSIYMTKAGNDRYDKIVYLDREHLPEDFNGRILSYVDAHTPMYRFEGNMITVEYVRGIVSAGLAGGLAAGGVCTGVFAVKSKKKAEMECENINGK